MKKTTMGHTLAASALLVAMLAGCGTAPAQPAATPLASESSAEQESTEVLDRHGQLALGTLRLEDTGNPVAAEQAAALRPLWQAIQSGALQSEAETNAVQKQIEAVMTAAQLATIQAMQLTWDDLSSWAQSQGMSLDTGQSFRALEEGAELPAEVQERLREQYGGELPSPEEVAALRAQRGKLSDGEQQAMRDSAEASGRALGRRGAALGPWAMLLDPLIELLTERAQA
jgi:hypothetical protein